MTDIVLFFLPEMSLLPLASFCQIREMGLPVHVVRKLQKECKRRREAHLKNTRDIIYQCSGTVESDNNIDYNIILYRTNPDKQTNTKYYVQLNDTFHIA